MTNVLDGVQFRTYKADLPSWRNSENYTDWVDCGSTVQFPSGTEFRVTPCITYVVTDAIDKQLFEGNKNEAMSKVASMLADDTFAAIRKEVRTSPGVANYLSDQTVQFKLTGSEKWMNPVHFGGKAVGSPIRFRKRPDIFWEVSVKTGIAQSTINFDDVDELDKYVSRQLRTSDNNLVITRRAYGLTHNFI